MTRRDWDRDERRNKLPDWKKLKRSATETFQDLESPRREAGLEPRSGLDAGLAALSAMAESFEAWHRLQVQVAKIAPKGKTDFVESAVAAALDRFEAAKRNLEVARSNYAATGDRVGRDRAAAEKASAEREYLELTKSLSRLDELRSLQSHVHTDLRSRFAHFRGMGTSCRTESVRLLVENAELGAVELEFSEAQGRLSFRCADTRGVSTVDLYIASGAADFTWEPVWPGPDATTD